MTQVTYVFVIKSLIGTNIHFVRDTKVYTVYYCCYVLESCKLFRLVQNISVSIRERLRYRYSNREAPNPQLQYLEKQCTVLVIKLMRI